MDGEALDYGAQRLELLDGLCGTRQSLVDIASSPGMFGQVPGADVAAAALATAADSLVEGLEQAGVSIDGIVNDALTAAREAAEADQAVRENMLPPADQDPHALPPMSPLEQRMADQPGWTCDESCQGH